MVVDSTIRFNDRMDGPSVSLGSKLSNAKVSFAIFKRDIKRLLVNPGRPGGYFGRVRHSLAVCLVQHRG